jgi:hypothetical protein
MKYPFEKLLPNAQQAWQIISQQEKQNQQALASLCSEIAEFMQQNLSLIDRKLVRDLSYISQLAYYDKGMLVKSVVYKADSDFVMHFEYEWIIFQGCMGLHENGMMQDKVSFSVDKEGNLLFDLTAFETLSTAGEL